MFNLSEEERERYCRQILLKDVGEEGQARIRDARVLVVGAGGLGSPVAFYLVAAGVGTVGIMDNDVVDVSNLQRQILHSTRDVSRAKVESAAEKLRALNPHVEVRAIRDRLGDGNAREYVREYDFVVDATDGFDAKYLINDACVAEGRAFSIGGIYGYEGQTMTHVVGSACYRCVFPAHEVGRKVVVPCIGAIVGMLGTIQATEALKYITGVGALLTDTLLTFDARTMKFGKMRVRRREGCGCNRKD